MRARSSTTFALALLCCLMRASYSVRPRRPISAPTGAAGRAPQPSAIALERSVLEQPAAKRKRTPGGVPVPPSPQLQEVLPLVGKVADVGEHMLGAPSIFRGVSPDGELTDDLPRLGREEELELVRQAWFFVAAADAEREIQSAADAADELYSGMELNHERLLRQMRARATADRVDSALAKQGVPGKSAAAGSMSELCVQLPAEMSDTEFRLMEALGRGAYNKLFLHNRGLIYHEVHQLFPSWRTATVMEKADLLQEGAQGLLRAIRLFDPARAVRFSTYATWHVRSYILRAVRDKAHTVRLPQNLQQDMQQIRKARYRYAVENQGHSPSPRDLADTLQWPTSRVEAALEGLKNSASISLDESAAGEAGAAGVGAPDRQPLINSVPSTRHGSAASENALYQQQLRATLSQAMRERDPRRVQLIRLRYGIEDGKEWSYPQLAARFNMTANAAKGIVHAELKFLRRERRQVLKHFVSY